MSNKSIFQEFNQDALEHFSLEDEPVIGFISSPTSLEIHKVIMTQIEDKFERLEHCLHDNEYKKRVKTPKGHKKAFIIPGCSASTERIKAVAADNNIKITNNYEIADLFIGDESVRRVYKSGEKIKATSFLFELWNYDIVESTSGVVPSIDAYPFGVLCESDINDKLWDLYSYRPTSIDTTVEMCMTEYIITGMALNIAYLIETDPNIEIINAEDFILSGNHKLTLDSKLSEEITGWLNSEDESDLLVLSTIIPTIDYNKNPHLIWELAREIRESFYKLDINKDFKFWLNCIDYDDVKYYTPEDMILHLHEKEKLCSESFCYLEKKARTEIDISNRNLYVFKVKVKPEYEKYKTCSKK